MSEKELMKDDPQGDGGPASIVSALKDRGNDAFKYEAVIASFCPSK